MDEVLRVFLVEDEVLLQMQMAMYLEDAGHQVAGYATSAHDALARAPASGADLVLVDIHLADGPTGVEVGRELVAQGIPVVFVTANARRIPEDFCGAIGVIAKPYSQSGIGEALRFLLAAIRNPPPPAPVPTSLTLATEAAQRWSLA